MPKLCLSAKFSRQEIRWNYGIFRSDGQILHAKTCDWLAQFWQEKFCNPSPQLVAPKLQTRLISCPNLQNHVIQRTSATLNAIAHIFFIVHYRVAAKVYFFKVNNRTIRKRCEITSKLIKTPERRHLMAVGEGVGKIFISKLHKWRRSGVFIVNVIHLFLVFFFLFLNK